MSAAWIEPEVLQKLHQSQTNALRIRAENDFWIDQWGEDFLLSVKNPADATHLLAELLRWAEEREIPIRRVYAKPLVHQPKESDKPQLLHGDPTLPSTNMVMENGIRFEADFSAGYSVGLFIDQRNNREKLVSLHPKRVLNCFSYTCAFSVAAALHGAETVSVDLAKRALEWGKRNFVLNGLDPSAHRFIADDVLKVLPRLSKREDRFDAIILDPPTFSRSRETGVFQVEKDFPHLLRLALACAEDSAAILLSTNCTRLSPKDLEAFSGAECKAAGCQFSFEHTPLPRDIENGVAPSTLWLKIHRP